MSRAHRTCDFHRIRLKQRPPSLAIPRPTIRPSSGRVVRRSTHPGHWPRRLVCPLVGSHRCRLSVGSPGHVSAVSGPGTRPGIRPVIHDDQLEGPALLPWFPLRFRRRRSLLGHPVPARELSLPHGRPTGQRPDPDGVSVFHTYELRSGWVPSLLRGRRCSSRPESLTGRHPRPLNRWSLNPAAAIHRCGALLDEASTEGSRVLAIG